MSYDAILNVLSVIEHLDPGATHVFMLSMAIGLYCLALQKTRTAIKLRDHNNVKSTEETQVSLGTKKLK